MSDPTPPDRPGFFRQLLRAAAMALAALSLTWGTALPSGLAAALIGAALGVPVGQALGRSRVRLPVVLLGLAAFAAVGYGLAAFAVGAVFFPTLVGTGTALRTAAALRFGVAALAITASLRSIAARKPAAASIEVVALAAAIPSVFASHRDGIIARPLWISDFAWQRGIDPTHIFLGLGGAAIAVLAVLLLLETRSGRAPSSLLALAALIALALGVLPLLGLPTPKPPNDLGLTDRADGGNEPADAGGKPADGGSSRGARPEQGDGGDPLDGGAIGQESDQLDGGGSAPQDGGPKVAQSEHLEDQGSGKGGEAPMAVVILDDDYAPPSGGFYFRQEAWSSYNGARLVRANRGDVDGDQLFDFPVRPSDVPDPPLEPGRSRVHATVALLVEHTHPFALESPLRFTPAQNPNPTRFLRAYKFESLAQVTPFKELLGRKSGDARWPKPVLDYYLEGPTDPRYAALAKQIAGKVPAMWTGDPFATALTVKLWLDDQLTYSSKARHAGVPDPTADFLFGDRTGYCVHFAHAAVLLWRSLGIPARVGTGYRTEEDDRHGSSTILIRASDAHAWPELYLDGLGWVVLDIAAKKNIDEPPPPVDSDLQRLLGEMARQMPHDPVHTTLTETSSLAFGKDLLRALLIAAAVTVVALYLIKIWRRLAPFVVRPKRLPVAGYRLALDHLAEIGFTRRLGETREAFARRAAAVAPSFAALTDLHLAGALGDPARDAASREELSRPRWREGNALVSREIRAASRFWRRLVGALDPASFLRAR
ncbi:MAG: transglutaminase-like domain-containing protein [Byssovorax sp.]